MSKNWWPRIPWLASLVVLLAVAVAGVTAADRGPRGGAGDDDDDDHGPGKAPQSRVALGFEIAPVDLDLQRKNRNMVGLGSYIVNAQGGCNDCHTCPSYAEGSDPFSGAEGQVNATNYLAGGVAFGPFVSKNLTPDENGRPAGLTRDEFVHLLRTGESPHVHGRLLQVMPWPVYGNMTDRDLHAVYEYLRAIPPAEPGVVCGAP